jgi:enoyl-CoA hydratase/3-hydroxyacyl-CoA dehydrogenase
MADFGFVNSVVDESDFEEKAHQMAASIAQNAPLAQQFTKRIMNTSRTDIGAALELSAQTNGLLVNTADYHEGVTAFEENRDPDFVGE